MTERPIFELKRTFDAPCASVWWGWTDPEPLAHWYGPGVETIIHKLDVKPGGLWLCEMKWGENSNYQKAEYIEVVPMERLTWIHSTTDKDWNIAPSMMPNWPTKLKSELTLEEDNGATNMKFIWIAHEATDEEIACFSEAMGQMGQGWSKGMDLLAETIAAKNG